MCSGRFGVFLRQTPTRLFLGFALRLGFAGEAFLLLAFTRVGGGALNLVLRIAFGAGLRFDFGAATVFFLAGAGVYERPGAGFALIVGQGA